MTQEVEAVSYEAPTLGAAELVRAGLLALVERYRRQIRGLVKRGQGGSVQRKWIEAQMDRCFVLVKLLHAPREPESPETGDVARVPLLALLHEVLGAPDAYEDHLAGCPVCLRGFAMTPVVECDGMRLRRSRIASRSACMP